MYPRRNTNKFFAIVLFGIIFFFTGLVSASEYQVNYEIQNEWGSGFIAEVTLVNNSDSAIDGWTVQWTFPDEGQTIVNGWNGVFSQSGTQVTVTDASYNGYIPSGGEATFGFQGSYSGSNPIPTDITLNGQSTGDDGDDSDDSSDDDSSDDDADNDDQTDDGDDTDDTGDGNASITLNGTSISVSGTGATVNGSVVTITSAGTYNVSGTLSNGQIAVDTADEGDVRIVLDGVNITNTSNSPIYVINAGGETIIDLEDGSSNYLTDGSSYNLETGEDEPNAALFSKDDLTIEGNGSLTVTGNYNDGIATKDDLNISGGTITVQAKDDGIRGKNSIEIKNADITVDADGDGLKADNEEDADKGFITIESGTVDITAGGDAVQAERVVTIDGGTLDILAGGGSNSTISEDDSAKGLKSGVDININGGIISIDSADDALNANSDITIAEGTLTLASGDDAIHADLALTIDNGDINATKSVEGLEGSAITINNGNIIINASDDGINASNGDEWATSNSFDINGGYVAVYANGDGLDSNGTLTITGGVTVVHGPTENMNGATDANSTFRISGGTLAAAGSSGMAQAPATSSSQYSVLVNFDTTLSANTLVSFQTSGGSEVVTFKPSKTYQSVLISTPDLSQGSYRIYTGGRSTATETDGLYENGSYSSGTLYTDFTISSIVTTIGGGGGFFPFQ